MQQDEHGVTRGWLYQPDVPDFDTEQWTPSHEREAVAEAENALHEFNTWRETGRIPSPPKTSKPERLLRRLRSWLRW